MKIEVLDYEKNKLKFKILNTHYTFTELLQQELLQNPKVVMASYTLDHPEDPDVVFFVKVGDKEDVKKIILGAIEKIKQEFNEFEKQALASLK